MTPELLRRFGQSVYGSAWQSPLSRDLGVNDRTVRRWASGEWPIPARVWHELHAIGEKHMGEIYAVLRELRDLRDSGLI